LIKKFYELLEIFGIRRNSEAKMVNILNKTQQILFSSEKAINDKFNLGKKN
jgi:hypothetical protein